MRGRALLAFIAAALAALALAQEAPQESPQAPASTTAPAAESATDAEPAPRGAGSEERFVPSEDISEDLSVSFPSDI